MSDQQKSKLLVWDCIGDRIRKEKFFNISLLRKTYAKNHISLSMALKSSEDIYGYDIPKIWFKQDYEGIILWNPFKKSFIMANEQTSQNTINKILNKYLDKNMENYPELLIIGHNILFLAEKENSTIVRNLNKES